MEQNPNNTNEVPETSQENTPEDTTPETVVEETSATEEVVETAQASSEEPVASDAEASDAAGAAELDDDSEDAVSASDDAGDEDDTEDDNDTDDSFPFKRGDLIEGTITETAPTEIMVDLGQDVVGIVPSRELEFLDKAVIEDLAVGGKLFVYVTRPNPRKGQPTLSISRALEERDWRDAEAYAENKQVYEGHIAGYNKGGLIVRFGRLRGFIPASQISIERERRSKGESPDDRWSGMLNETILVKVVEVNRARNRLILSERAASREYREQRKQKLIEELKVGEIRKGTVISLTDFGAFVDLGGADGLVHLTELSWKHVNNPREMLSIGQEVEVKVISVDPERKRIGLSMKSLEDDPWQAILAQYHEDQLVQGKITKLTRFGAFASLMDNEEVEGLIHVSELADYRVEHPRDVVAVGDVLTLRVIKIDADRRRLGLSLKRVNSSKYMSSDWDSWNP